MFIATITGISRYIKIGLKSAPLPKPREPVIMPPKNAVNINYKINLELNSKSNLYNYSLNFFFKLISYFIILIDKRVVIKHITIYRNDKIQYDILHYYIPIKLLFPLPPIKRVRIILTINIKNIINHLFNYK